MAVRVIIFQSMPLAIGRSNNLVLTPHVHPHKHRHHHTRHVFHIFQLTENTLISSSSSLFVTRNEQQPEINIQWLYIQYKFKFHSFRKSFLGKYLRYEMKVLFEFQVFTFYDLGSTLILTVSQDKAAKKLNFRNSSTKTVFQAALRVGIFEKFSNPHKQ